MLNKSTGVSLLEMSIVIAILALVTSAVTTLSIKLVQNQQNQRVVSYQNHIFNNIQNDLRQDLSAVFSVFVTSGGSGTPGADDDYYVSKSCATTTVNPVNGDTLNIVKISSQTATDITFSYIRYQFINNNLVRKETIQSARTGLASQFWPEATNNAAAGNPPAPGGYYNPKYQAFPACSLADPTAKIYYDSTATDEPMTITGTFQAIYGSQIQPPSIATAWNTNCSFYASTINITNLAITATGDSTNTYDQVFGKSNYSTSTISFNINSNTKFY